MLCAALASCIGSTLRVVANRLRIPIEELSVQVTSEVDVRGTLCMTSEVPVGMQRMDTRVRIKVAADVSPSRRRTLIQAAEHCCVVLRTLRDGVPVELQK